MTELPAADRLAAATPSDGWGGLWPLPEGHPMPDGGQAVIYYLYDIAGLPCYVGSTGRLARRLREHARSGKRFTSWVAAPYPTRQAAYAEEVAMLRDFIGDLAYNRRVGR